MYPQNEVRANTDEWISLGMHGNQSGPLICEGILPEDRRVGPFGKGYIAPDVLRLDSSVPMRLQEGTIPRGEERGGEGRGGEGRVLYLEREDNKRHGEGRRRRYIHGDTHEEGRDYIKC